MSEQVYKVIELVGASDKSVDDAVRNAIARASKTLHNLRWFQIAETRGNIVNGQVSQYQVVLRVGFHLDEAS